MFCPKCGSKNVVQRHATETVTRDRIKGFGWIKACLGYLFCSVPGLLCGLCGMGKGVRTTTTTVKSVNVCQECGYRF